MKRFLLLQASILACLAFRGSAGAAVHYVNVNSASSSPPYINWATAARTIQEAVDVALAGDEIVVTNGVYRTGGRAVFKLADGVQTNRVAITKPVIVRSVNGPVVTFIHGYQVPGTTNGDAAVRCVYLTNGAALVGFTLTNGATQGWPGNLTTYDRSYLFGGGGVWGESDSAFISNCVLSGNSASDNGGGARGGRLNNCILIGNSAFTGGGADGSILNNCTISGNSASGNGGGVYFGTLNNCIVYNNSARVGLNYSGDSDVTLLNYCCTTPRPSRGVGNFTNAPLFLNQTIGDFRLQPNSPCINAGLNIYAPAGPDLDGNPRIVGGSVDIGAYEFQSPGAAVRYVNVNSANPIPPYTNWTTAATVIQDAVDVALPGDEIIVANGVYQTGGSIVTRRPEDGGGTRANRVAVLKPLTLRSLNGPEATVIRGDSSGWRCVYLTNGATLLGFTLTKGSAEPCCNTFEGAGGGVWCESASAIVSNCVLIDNSAWYGGGASGGTLNNCTLIGNWAALGGGATGATLNNCTLDGNRARFQGGGAWFATLNNCTLTGNSATWGDASGGGAYSCMLNTCSLIANSAANGGGAYGGTLNNCTLTGNSASSEGGGAWVVSPCDDPEKCGLPGCQEGGCSPTPGLLNNCIIYYNYAPIGANYQSNSILNYCSTTPLPVHGVGNIINAPLFADAAAGNFRLQANSPCINAGWNAYAPAGSDLDGNPRIVGGTVDIGAHEFQSPQSALSYAWLQQYGLLTDGSADFTDPDGDGLSNLQEWRAGTDPTNSLSVLRLLSPVAGRPGVIVRWQSLSGRVYLLERTSDLGAHPIFSSVVTNIVGAAGTTVYADTNAVGIGPFFYRVGLKE